MSLTLHSTLLATLAAALLLLMPACGQSVDAPLEALPPLDCPTIDQTLAGTLEAIADGQTQAMSEVLEEAVAIEGQDDPIARLLRLILALVQRGDLGQVTGAAEGLDVQALDLDALGSVLADALRPLTPQEGRDPAVVQDRLLALEGILEAADTCPQGSLTGLVRGLLDDRPLIDALAQVLLSERFWAFFAPLTDPAIEDAGRRAVSTLLDQIFNILTRDPFDIQALAGPLNTIMPIDEPPMEDLVRELERHLVADGGLMPISTVLACVDGVERQTSQERTITGRDMISDLLYNVLAAFGPDPLALLAPLLAQDSDPDALLGAVDGLLALINEDLELRAEILALLDFFLAPERAGPILQGAVALLDAGALAEFANLFADIAAEQCQASPQALSLRLGL